MTTARPILFSAPMVRALLAGTKTQTRRIVKPQPPEGQHIGECPYSRTWWAYWNGTPAAPRGCTCAVAPAPYGWNGDLLWAREAWRVHERFSDVARIRYQASERQSWTEQHEDFPVALSQGLKDKPGYRPSIHMPRWASRITLAVTDVRVQRLQDISEEDAQAEGVTRIGREYPSFADPDSDWHRAPNLWTVEDGLGSTNAPTAGGAYRMLWELINGPGSWDANPWVWAVSFDVHLKNVDAVIAAKGEA
jgi:hypothetical protein